MRGEIKWSGGEKGRIGRGKGICVVFVEFFVVVFRVGFVYVWAVGRFLRVFWGYLRWAGYSCVLLNVFTAIFLSSGGLRPLLCALVMFYCIGFFGDCYVWLWPGCVCYTCCLAPGYIHSWSGNINYCNRWGGGMLFALLVLVVFLRVGVAFRIHILSVPLSICADSFFASFSLFVVWRWVVIDLYSRFVVFEFCVLILGRWVARRMLFWKQMGLLHTWPLYILFVMVFAWVLPDPHS